VLMMSGMRTCKRLRLARITLSVALSLVWKMKAKVESPLEETLEIT
jgi:hypothetical protein